MDKVTQIKERRDSSKKYMEANFYPEWIEVDQACKCKTDPIMVTDSTGKEVEDTSRTNVANPILAVMKNRNTARMTAQPPKLRYRVPNDQDGMAGEKLSAMNIMQYENSGEAKEHRKMVGQAEQSGIGITKVFRNSISVTRRFRYSRLKLVDRTKLMQLQGASEDEIANAVAIQGPQLNDAEISAAIAEEGPEVIAKEDIKKYEGPCIKNIFIGDFFYEPGFSDLNECAWMGDTYPETEVWLKSKLNATFQCEATNGEEVPLFDEKAVSELIKNAEKEGWLQPGKQSDLRTQMTSKRGKTDVASGETSSTDLKPGKRFQITECHEMKDGDHLIFWTANDKVCLNYKDPETGEPVGVPYSAILGDFGNRYAYTAYVPLPDSIEVVGDSTLRLGRYLYRLVNATMGQTIDLVSACLRPTVITEVGADILDEQTERRFAREVKVKGDPSSIRWEQIPDVPASAWETKGMLMRDFNMLEPSIGSVDSGSAANPMAGKTATTAVLAQRATDLLTQYKFDQLDLYHKELGEKKLAIWQWTAQESTRVGKQYFSHSQALMEQYGQVGWFDVDPLEYQTDIGVETEAASYLSVDDEFRRMNLQNAMNFSAANPGIIDTRKLALPYLTTLKDIGNPAEYIIPEQPPDPLAGAKINFSISVAMEKQPAEIQKQLWEMAGFNVAPGSPAAADLDHQAALQGIQEIGKAADAAGKLVEPAVPASPNAPPQEPTRKTMAGKV